MRIMELPKVHDNQNGNGQPVTSPRGLTDEGQRRSHGADEAVVASMTPFSYRFTSVEDHLAALAADPLGQLEHDLVDCGLEPVLATAKLIYLAKASPYAGRQTSLQIRGDSESFKSMTVSLVSRLHPEQDIVQRQHLTWAALMDGLGRGGDPCGACKGCTSISGSCGTIFTDGYLEYDASKLSTEQMLQYMQRDTFSNRLTPPPNRRYRRWIVCIDEVVHADPKLQHNLVKFVENVTRARFVLCYSDPSRIHPALASRGLEIRLTPATTDQASAAIIKIANAEGFHIDVGAARVLVDSVRCLPRDCIKTLELAARLTTGSTIALSAVQQAVRLTGKT